MANTYEMIFEAVDKTGKTIKNIDSNLDKLNRKTKNVNGVLSRLSTVGSKAAGVLGKLGLAATAAAGAFAFFANRNLQALDALGKTASKLGVTTQFLSRYQFVAEQAGLSTLQFDIGLQRFLRRLGQAQTGTGELVKPLKALGISMKDANGNFRDGTEVFDEFITKLGQTTNKQQQLALAMGAFDTEGVAFVNIAAMGSSEIERLGREAEKAGLIIDERLTTNAEEARDAIGELLARARGFGLQFFGEMAPALETLADDIKKAVDDAVAGAGGMGALGASLAADFIRGTATFIETLATLFDGFNNSVRMAGNILKQLVVSISKIPGAGFDATFDGAGIETQRLSLEKEITELMARQSELVKERAEVQARMDAAPTNLFGMKQIDQADIGAMTQISLEMNEIANSIQNANTELSELGDIIVLEKLATDSTVAADATKDLVTALTDQATKLDEVAANAKKANDEAAEALRHRGDNLNLLGDMTGVLEDQNTVIEQASVKFMTHNEVMEASKTKLQELRDELTKNQNEQRILNETLRMAKELYASGAISVSYLNDMLEKLGETTNNYSDYTLDFNKRLRENTTLEYNRIKMLQEINRRYEEGSLNATEYGVALRMLGESVEKGNEPLETYTEMMERLNKALDKSDNETKNLKKAQAELNKIIEQGGELTKRQQDLLNEVNSQLGVTSKETFNVLEELNSGFEGMIGTVSNTFTDVILGLKDGFEGLKDIATSALRVIINTLIEAFIRSQILGQSIGGLGGGGGLLGGLFSGGGAFSALGALSGGTLAAGLLPLVGVGALLGGFLADGGPAKAGTPYVVGERGPELFVPNTSGTVVSNEEMNAQRGEGDLNVSFTINSIDTQTGVEFLIENKNVITGVIQEAYRRRGSEGPLG